jgi:hypothetical protein
MRSMGAQMDDASGRLGPSAGALRVPCPTRILSAHLLPACIREDSGRGDADIEDRRVDASC